MPSVNLKGMGVDDLIALREDIEKHLGTRRRELEQQLTRLGTLSGKASRGGRGHPSKGSKVPPKFRGPGGETWAGRGARPRWLVALVKQGRKLEEFSIGGDGGTKKVGRRKRAAKKSGA